MSNNTEEDAPTGAKSGIIIIVIIVPSVLIILLLTLVIMNRRRGLRDESQHKEKRWKTRQDELESHIKSQNFYDWLASQKEKCPDAPQPHDPLCAICLDDFADDAQVRGLHCSHAFHSHCLDEWFTRYNEYCPLCHRPIIPGSRASRRKARERLDPTIPVVLMV